MRKMNSTPLPGETGEQSMVTSQVNNRFLDIYTFGFCCVVPSCDALDCVTCKAVGT